MKRKYDIGDDEIRIIGYEESDISISDDVGQKKHRLRKFIFAIMFFIILALCIILTFCAIKFFFYNNIANPDEQSLFESDRPANVYYKLREKSSEKIIKSLFCASKLEANYIEKGATYIKDTIINDVGLKLFYPNGSTVALQIGTHPIDENNIIYISQAADVRADNNKILGSFVLDGKPIARGSSKKGYCAIIDENITVGVSENTSLFEEATEKNGYFFRQYPLVNNGTICENEPKGKSLRRAICQIDDITFIVHSTEKESFHDFSQALVDLGVDNAIYLVGGDAKGWALLPDGTKEEWGTNLSQLSKNTSYIVFRK